MTENQPTNSYSNSLSLQKIKIIILHKVRITLYKMNHNLSEILNIKLRKLMKIYLHFGHYLFSALYSYLILCSFL